MANFIDNIVGFFSPKAGFKRAHFRTAMEGEKRRFEGAAEGRRHANWMQRNNPSVNQLIEKDLKRLVSRSRELFNNNPYAHRAPKKIANNVVGTGIIPSPYVPPVIKDGKVTQVNGADKAIELCREAWKQWAENPGCDYNGDYNFYGLQHLAMKTVGVSGEILFIRKKVPSSVNPFGFQVLALEGDFIDLTKMNVDPKDGYVHHGIMYDNNNRRTGYWLHDRHPSEGWTESKFVSVEDVIHVYEVERAGQNRGLPMATPTILKQRDLDDYEDAELLGKKTAACMPIFVTNQDPDYKKDGEGKPIEYVEPGVVNYLEGGQSVSFATPPASTGYAEYTKTQHRAVANGYGMSYESFTNDYSNVNFSSGRMGWLEFQREIYNWQYLMLIPKFCDKVWGWFTEQLVVAKGLSKNITVKANWTPPRREMIDPVKETQAKRLAIRSGLMSWEETVKQDGFNPEDVIAEYKKNYEDWKAAGIIADWTPAFELEINPIKESKAAKSLATKG